MRLRNNKNREVYKDMKKGTFLLVLSGCLLLAGCQKETVAEEDASDEEVTIISVLGKAELTIANERFCSDESSPGIWTTVLHRRKSTPF